MKNSVLVVVNPSKEKVKEIHGERIIPTINSISKGFKNVIVVNSIDSEFTSKYDRPVFLNSQKGISMLDFENKKLSLRDFLTKNGITDVFLVGLFGETDLKDLSFECQKEGLRSHYVLDCTRFRDGKLKDTLKELIENDINVINSNDIKIFQDENKGDENKR